MSTKIYNGRILKDCSLAEALKRLQGIREECVRRAQASVAMRIAKCRYFWADMDENFLPYPRKHFDSFFWRVLEIIGAERTKVLGLGERSVDWDFTLDVLLIPFGNHVLSIHFLENDPGFTELLKVAGFEDYHYQNSTDRPDDVSESEWQARESAWSLVLPSGVPAHSGLTYTLVSWEEIRLTVHNRELILTTKPSDEYRRRRVAMYLIDPAPRLPEIEHMALFQRAKLAQTLADQRAPYVYLASDESVNS